MKKQTKGAIAAAAAGALLLGGAGSLALWSDSETIGGNTINSGTLTLGACTPVTTTSPSGWVSTNPAVTPIPDITAWHIVPTENISYSCTTTVTAVGDRLSASIVADTSTITGDAALLANITSNVTVEAAGAPGTPITTITEDNAGDFTVIVTLGFADVNDLVAQTSSINLANLNLVLQQQPIV